MPITAFGERVPVFGRDAFVHPAATIVGDVVLGDGASIWPGAVLRGDLERITIGSRSNIQDNSVAHTDVGYPLVVGNDCVVGHAVILHGGTVGNRCLIGMGSTLLDGCEIGDDSIVGAHALVTRGKRFPPRSLIMGSPGKVLRELSDDEVAAQAKLYQMYERLSREYAALGLGADLSPFRR